MKWLLPLFVLVGSCAGTDQFPVSTEPMPSLPKPCLLPELVVVAADDPIGTLVDHTKAAIKKWNKDVGMVAYYAGTFTPIDTKPMAGLVIVDWATQEVSRELKWKSDTLGEIDPYISIFSKCYMGGRVWVNLNTPEILMVPVIVHELGHLFGANHVEEDSTYMSSSINDLDLPTKFSDNTIAEVTPYIIEGMK